MATQPRSAFDVFTRIVPVLHTVTVAGSIATAIFVAGQWVSQVRSDLRSETASRIEHDDVLTAALASQLAAETADRKAASEALMANQATLQANQAATLATLVRIERSFQHVFAATQPQPARK